MREWANEIKVSDDGPRFWARWEVKFAVAEVTREEEEEEGDDEASNAACRPRRSIHGAFCRG